MLDTGIMDLGQTVSPKSQKRRYNPKYTVFGYVRSSQTSLSKASSYSLFRNIPIAITSLCVLYYEPIEYFDIINTDDIKLSEDKKSIYKYHQRRNYESGFGYHFGLDNTSFGKISIPSTSKSICKWYFKINNIPKKPSFDPFRIGIVSKISSVNKSFLDKAKNEDYKFYGYQTGSRILENHYGRPQVPTYGRYARVNDVYCMKLDLQKREIRYSRNNKSFGIAFENIDIGEDIEYKLAVTIGHKDGNLSMMKYVERL